MVSTQHGPEASLDQIRQDMIQLVIKPIIPAELLDDQTKIYVNPTGRFVIGGPQETPASPGGRSSWTPTAAALPTEAALSPAKDPH